MFRAKKFENTYPVNNVMRTGRHLNGKKLDRFLNLSFYTSVYTVYT